MDNNKRILINTGVLYGKLAITTVVGLIASRYILLSLGSSDFGLYSVVGGIVTFLNVIGVTMVSTSYRFLGVGLGMGDTEKLRNIYSSLSFIHWGVAILLIVLGEILGLYYIDNYLVIPIEKVADARFVFHISLITAAISVVTVPANGLIIAKEKFVFTSIVEIFVALLRLSMIIYLIIYTGNRLRLYAIIMMSIQILTTLLYQAYCYVRDRNIVSVRFNTNVQDYKDIASFTGWSLLGATAYIGNNQGAAIIINLFFGTILNAAYGIASQVNSYTNTFIKGITQAAVPQIMKNYGAGNEERTLNLVYIISRISSLALLLILVPLLTFTDVILEMWLKEPPIYSVEFVRLLLISVFISVLGAGFDSCIQSTGHIKKNELFYSIIYLSQLPVMYIAYKYGAPPYFNAIILCISTILLRLYQAYLLSRLTSFEISSFWVDSVKPVIFATFWSFCPIIFLKLTYSFAPLISWIIIPIYEIWISFCLYVFGLKSMERDKIVSLVRNKIMKRNRDIAM